MKPICWLCQKPVEFFEVTRGAKQQTYTAKCHGDKQTVSIGLLDTMRSKIAVDYAFRPVSAAVPDGTDISGRRLPTNYE